MTRTTNLARGSGLATAFIATLLASAVTSAQEVPITPAPAVHAAAEAPTPVTPTVTPDNVVHGYTSKPYALARPWVNQFGTVLERPVKVGQAVKKGDILLRQDDRQERAQLEALELEANSNVRVEAAEADLKLKAAQYKREQDLLKTNSTNPVAVEEAQSKWIYADAQLKIAKLEREVNLRKAEQQRVKVEQMTVKSPVDGYVEQIELEVGDMTDPQKPCITVVQNDPLKVEFFIPVPQAQKLKVGQELQVRYPGEEQWTAAKVAFKAPVAETASDTQKVGLEMANSQNRDAGLQVQVKLPDDVVAAAGR
jgi:RND family efflux transporter MFP subunit